MRRQAIQSELVLPTKESICRVVDQEAKGGASDTWRNPSGRQDAMKDIWGYVFDRDLIHSRGYPETAVQGSNRRKKCLEIGSIAVE